jgi:hypothetical protein
MKTRRLLFAGMMIVFLGMQMAFSWGNATHVYFAKELGAKYGVPNLNEMYGSLMPDCFNFMLDAPGLTLTNMCHNNAMNVWLMAKTPAQKSLALGFMTHNQTWGADYTAHVRSFTFPKFIDPMTTEPGGYAIEKGYELLDQIVPELTKILVAAGVPETDADGSHVALMLATGIAPALGHDLSETAVDILLRRNIDREIGARMVLAAQTRPANAGALLAAAYAKDLAVACTMSESDATKLIIGAEQEYRKYIIQYGTAFTRPERQTIAMLSEATVPVAEMFIDAALGQNGFAGAQVTVTADQVTKFILSALDVVKKDYACELDRTLSFIEKGMRENGIRVGCRLFAHEAASEATAVADVAAMPENFALAQNSPNPFNPTTTIAFALPSQGHVRLTVFNMLGEEIATLVDDERPAGLHMVRWDAAHQPSGAYFYRIESGSFDETKRMLLVK